MSGPLLLWLMLRAAQGGAAAKEEAEEQDSTEPAAAPKSKGAPPAAAPNSALHKAAVRIQASYRGYTVRKAYKVRALACPPPPRLPRTTAEVARDDLSSFATSSVHTCGGMAERSDVSKSRGGNSPIHLMLRKLKCFPYYDICPW